MTPYQTKRQFSRRIRIETWESSKQSWHQWSNSINHHSGLDKKNGSVESACLCIHPSINGNFRILKMEVPTIYKAYFSGLCKGISPQNMAKHMVLTYLHQLDPGDLPLKKWHVYIKWTPNSPVVGSGWEPWLPIFPKRKRRSYELSFPTT